MIHPVLGHCSPQEDKEVAGEPTNSKFNSWLHCLMPVWPGHIQLLTRASVDSSPKIGVMMMPHPKAIHCEDVVQDLEKLLRNSLSFLFQGPGINS